MSLFGTRRIYLDYASATPVHQKAAQALSEAMGIFANPGALHEEGVVAKRLLTSSRERIGKHLGCKARELVFTSGLTESNTIAIVGTARALEIHRRSLEGTHWIVSSIEHSSVLECFAEVERMGGAVTHVEPDSKGIVAAEHVVKALRPETVFVSVGWGNNEIGTVQPLSNIAHALHRYEKDNKTTVLFHSDAGQAPLYLSPQVNSLGVDLFSLGSGKLYGPRGVGALHLSNRAHASPVMYGGGQERGLRPGTEDPALAAGFAAAFDVFTSERGKETKRLRKLRDDFAREIVARIPGIIVNGDLRHALPHMLNISVPGDKSGEYLALQLDHFGVALSTKSACREGETDSHVVAALGGPEWRAKNTLRFSLGRDTAEQGIKKTLDILEKVLIG
ncbi:cysteine desulfurase [Candidatus Kaiserbacteria bacterium]|nr:cysteine desulfurase [Candidatus Kaiserbacteria bacterium]